MKKLRIGTRGSELALWQAHHVQSLLQDIHVESELIIIKTQGDQVQHLSLDKLEGKGFFTKEIEEALLSNQIDIAVHSHKDLETEQPFGLTIAAVSNRADPSELLLIHPEAEDKSETLGFKKNAIFGTSSSRRKAQMLHHRSDITLKDIRGNVPTRIQKLRDRQFDAILLAKAGVDRLNLDLSDLIVKVLDPNEFVPAPAQGVLALQCRSNDNVAIEILNQLNNTEVQDVISIERGVLNKMKGGCHLPLGVYTTKKDDDYHVRVSYAPSWDAPNRFITFNGNKKELLVDQIINTLNAQHQ